MRKHRHHQPREQKGHPEGDRHGQGERLEEGAGHSTEEGERQEHDQRCGARAGERTAELRRGAQRVARRLRFAPSQTAHDVFDHHHRVVDDQADRCREPTERHDVEGLPEDVEQHHRSAQRRGHHEQRDQRDAQLAQKHQQHHGRQCRSHQDRIAHARRRREHQRALVVPLRQPDIARQLVATFGQGPFHILDDLDAVAVRLLIDHQQHGVLAVGVDPDPLGHRGPGHVSDVLQFDHAVGAGPDDCVTNAVELVEAGVGHDEKQLVLVFDAADCRDHIGRADGRCDIRHRQPERLQTSRIHCHPILLQRTAEHSHPRDAGYGRQQRPQLQLGEIAQGGRRQVVRRQTEPEDRKDRRIHPARQGLGTRRQCRQDLRNGRVHLQRRRRHVGAPVEVDRQFGAAAARPGAQIAHAGHASNRLLGRDRGLEQHLLRRPVAGVDAHDHARKTHLRKQRYRHPEREHQAGKRQSGEQEDQRAPMGADPGGEIQRPASRTAMPSRNS